MAQVKKRRRVMIHRHELENVPMLIHRIQLLLPTKDAARTSILSKSWLHAWSTYPAIRFTPSVESIEKKQNQRKHMRWIHQTLLRYHGDNLPITSLDLQFGIHTAFRSANKLIMQATSKSRGSLKELHLAILPTTSLFPLPEEIFLIENLHTLSLEFISLTAWRNSSYSLYFGNPSILCTNLRVLKLVDVYITQYVLHKLLSTCKLLQKIDIQLPVELRIIKVSNLPYLDELRICNLSVYNDIFEVDNVPSLRSLVYDTFPLLWTKPASFKLGTTRSLRELCLDNVSMDGALSSMIISSFPFLESLTLFISWCSVKILDIRCLTLQTLWLNFDLNNQIDVQVYAPNLLVYKHASKGKMPSLLFPDIPPQQIELCLRLNNPIDELFFLKVRETLELSSKFNISIMDSEHGVPAPSGVDDLRTILPFPATSVEEMVFLKQFDGALWENSLLFDAAFSICHPMYVKANNELNLKVADYLLNQLMVTENETGKVVSCEIRDNVNGRWVALTSSSLCLLDTTPLRYCSDELKVTEFKLSWCSP